MLTQCPPFRSLVASRRCAARGTARALSALALGAAFIPCAAHAQATRTYTGGGVGGLDIGTASNWSGGVLPDVVAGDTGQFDGSLAGNLALIYSNAAFAGASGNPGINLSLLASQTGSVNIDSGSNTSAFRINNITIAAGAGAFSLGDALATLNLTLGGATGTTHTFTNNSSNTATLNADVAFTGLTGAQTLALTGSGNWTLNNAIGNGGGTSLALTKSGTGATTLNGVLSYTGATAVSGGTLNLNSATSTIGASAVTLTGTSVLNFASTGTVTTTGQINTNTAAADATVVNHTQGTLAAGDTFLGNTSGSYSAYLMSGGALNVTNLRIGSAAPNTAGSTGLFQITGGTVTVPAGGLVTVNRGTNTTSVVNVSGGTLNAGGNNFNLGFSAGGTGVLTVSGGGLVVENQSVITGQNGSTGIVNLNSGGTLRTGFFSNSTGTGIVNFNGGTLQPFATQAGFLTLSGTGSANVYAGGAIIDTNTFNATIAQPLRATGGTTGVATIPVASGGGGYLAPPVVTFSGGGGTGATGIANLTGGVVTSITITSAGTGYTGAPTVTLVGGGPSTAATVGTVATGLNAADGGLTKTGTGTLTLTGASTYVGTTTVNNGVLATTSLAANGAASGIGAGTALALSGGGTFRYTGGTSVGDGSFNRTIAVGTGGGTLDNASGGGRFVFLNGSLTGSGALTFLDSSLAGDQWLVTSGSPGFSGSVAVGNGTAGSGSIQYRSNNASPFGTGTVQINGGGVLTADNGATTPSTLSNALILNGGALGTQTPALTFTGIVSLLANSTVGNPYTGYNGAVTFTNTISGGTGAALNVSTFSSATFAGPNTYTGPTNVNKGILAVTGSLAAGSAVTVNNTGTLTGTGTVAGSITVASGGTVNPGAVGAVGAFTTGAETFLSGSGLTFDYGNNVVDSLTSTGLVSGLDGANFFFNVVGNGTLTNPSYTLITAGSFANTNLPTNVSGLPSGYQLAYSGNSLTLVQITGAAAPEPASWASLGLGLLGVGGGLRVQRRRAGVRRA